MKRLLFAALVMALSACGGNAMQPTAVTPAMLAPAAAPAAAKGGGRLIYATGVYEDDVEFYSYKNGKLKGAITDGISEPSGACSDLKGNVFVANTGTSSVLEYPHGGTTSIGTLETSGEYPTDCAVSPHKTVAVASIESTSGGAGELLLFADEAGSPTVATCPNMQRYYFDGYDGAGNLFVDGETSSGEFAFCEVPKGSSEGSAITLNKVPGFPGGVVWDGKYVAIMDQDSSTIDRYAISGSNGTLKGTVKLGGDSGQDVASFVMANKKTIVASSLSNGSGIAFYHYPEGGSPYKTFKTSQAIAVTLSPEAKL